MSPQPQTAARAHPLARWTPLQRVAFRLAFVYFSLFCLLTQILSSLIPWGDIFESFDPAALPPVRFLVTWTAAHILHLRQTLAYAVSGSGDKTYDWVLCFCILLVAVAAAAVWSVVDRKRNSYEALYKWFRLAMRFALASQMLVYGFSKAIPLQMPFPYLQRLLEPYGNFSPMGVLWSSVGAAPAYEIFAGCTELLGGILLIVPRTAILGALVSLAAMVQVFVLNMTYDVPVKLFAFHMIVLSLVLLAPFLGRMAAFFFGLHEVQPAREPRLFASRRAERIAVALQIAFGLVLAFANVRSLTQAYVQYGPGRPKSALYGIWDVDEMSVDGQPRPPLLTDRDRWRRVVFDFQTGAAFERPDDTFVNYRAAVDTGKKILTLSKSADKNWKATLNFARPAPGELDLDGAMDGHQLHLKLRAMDLNKFTLKSRGFHWIQESPYNR